MRIVLDFCTLQILKIILQQQYDDVGLKIITDKWTCCLLLLEKFGQHYLVQHELDKKLTS